MIKIDYEVIENWEKLPEGWKFVEVAGVATDSRDRVYAFNRGEHPMIVFDSDGNFLDSWGEGIFTNPHGIFIGPDDTIYLADNFDHTIRIFNTDGQLLKTLGEPHKPAYTGFKPGESPVQFGGGPFNRVTNACLSSKKELFVADGYGNARVHKFNSQLEYEFSWGEPGTGPGEFRLPHAIVLDPDDRVLVADRENSRIQVFDSSGKFLMEWSNVVRPDDLFIDAAGILFVAELGEIAGRSPDVEILPHMPHARVSLLDLDGNIIHQFGGSDPVKPGNFFAPHGIWADSKGDLYVAEVIYSGGANRGLVPLDCHSLQKFKRITHE
ncbi:MAG: peptidyl-alpha-hydroxyglycine alpha-amidating lyase family protein [Gammaproteobacteria bacterium]|nr:peptidyl-alpha-hydroxyglycine alpha-amidating lyase family protein [Gammaproteobacteria bacterium]